MSWDNVTGIKNIKIWTDYSDVTQGHLFVNDQHQLTLHVGVTFNLSSSDPNVTPVNPTEDEVKSALSLINNLDSGPLKYLTIVEANRYSAVYGPYHTQAVTTDNHNDVEDGIYDFTFTYIVSSPTSINAECYSESVALKLEYTNVDKDGKTVSHLIETSATGTGSSTKTSVAIVCYPAKLYGNKGESRTNILIANKMVADADLWDVSGNFSHAGDTFFVYWVYIDDTYFKMFYFDGCTEPDSSYVHNGFYIHKEYSKPEWDHVFNSFFPNVKCGEMDFDTRVAVRSGPDTSYPAVVTENITVHQQENQITFISGFSSAKALKYAGEVGNSQRIKTYDQFGNSSYIIVTTNYSYSSDSNNGHIILCSVS